MNYKQKPIQNKMEKISQDFFYKNHFENWIDNFGKNLPDIWKLPSAKNLIPKKERNDSAIIIGRGPSLKKFNHLKLLANSKYDGNIICTDGALKSVLESGVTPDKFPKFFVVSVDPDKELIPDFFDHKIIRKYGNKINGIFSILLHPLVIKNAKKAKIKINWIHTLFDYQEGMKSFNNISALIVRSKKNVGLPAIQTGGNAGTSGWFVSWKILKCNTITLIGINHGWEETDSLKTIMSHGNVAIPPKISQKSKLFRKLYPKIFNPDFQTYCILDPIFNYYRNALIEFISRSPKSVKTINATEGGSVYGDRITSMKFSQFLSKYSN